MTDLQAAWVIKNLLKYYDIVGNDRRALNIAVSALEERRNKNDGYEANLAPYDNDFS